MNSPANFQIRRSAAFTLVELLTVIAIIAVLMGLLFPTVGAVKESARKAQAKNDVTQLVTAVKAYYTEYGKYPVPSGHSGGDFTYDGLNGNDNKNLMNILRAIDGIGNSGHASNPRRIVFFEGTEAKEPGRYGFQTDGNFLDPWGNAYSIGMDADYDNTFSNPFTGGKFGPSTLRTGVVAWSGGKDTSTNDDNVVSWQ